LKAWCGISFGDNPLKYTHRLFLNGEEIKDLVIPDGVTRIESYTFDGYSSLTSVTIPNTVTRIESNAFRDCSHVEKLYLEDGSNTLSLGYNYPKGLFSSCSLKTLYLGRNLHYETFEFSGFSPFYKQIELESLIIGDSVTSIGENLFANCTNLANLYISNSVISIKNKAFENCSSLTNITIPNTLDNISNSALKGCINIVDMKIESGPTELFLTYDEDYCETIISTKRYCTLYEDCSLKNLFLGRNLNYHKNLPRDYYYNYIEIKKYWPKFLNNLTIGCYVKEINYIECGLCNLDSITIGTIIPPTLYIKYSYNLDCFNDYSYMNTIVKVPEGSLAAYQVAEVWKNFWNIQEDAALDIKNVVLDTEDTTAPIYNLQGVQMKESKEHLPAGIYIQGGKKMIVR